MLFLKVEQGRKTEQPVTVKIAVVYQSIERRVASRRRKGDLHID